MIKKSVVSRIIKKRKQFELRFKNLERNINQLDERCKRLEKKIEKIENLVKECLRRMKRTNLKKSSKK